MLGNWKVRDKNGIIRTTASVHCSVDDMFIHVFTLLSSECQGPHGKA